MSLITALRKPRVGPFAIFDFAASYAGALLAAPYLGKYISRERLLYLVVPTGVLAHALFKIDTPLNRMLLTKSEGNTLARVVVGAMLIRALTLKS
jgi:hypothetical protein